MTTEHAEVALTTDTLIQFFADLGTRCEHPTPRLADYDTILSNSSGGKDSQVQLAYLVWLCDRQGVSRDKLLVVHCDLGRSEWPGTRELAQEQAHGSSSG